MADVPKDIMEAERPLFEKFIKDDEWGDGNGGTATLERFGPSYAEHHVNAAWLGWLGRAALLSERERRTAQGVTVPEGWKLVPIVATIEMEHAAVKRVGTFHDENWYRIMPKDLFRLAWPALLAAAPSLSTSAGGCKHTNVARDPKSGPYSWKCLDCGKTADVTRGSAGGEE